MPPRKRAQPTPEQEAAALLDELKFNGVPVPVDRIAKALGAQLRYSPLDDELSGMVYIRGNVPIIGVNSLHHPNRQRFTIAHEIGHLTMHREVITNAVHVDKLFAVSVLRRDGASAEGTELREIQANRFAAALLMPTLALDAALADATIDIDDEATLEALARKFKVSRQALEFRIRNLS